MNQNICSDDWQNHKSWWHRSLDIEHDEFGE